MSAAICTSDWLCWAATTSLPALALHDSTDRAPCASEPDRPVRAPLERRQTQWKLRSSWSSRWPSSCSSSWWWRCAASTPSARPRSGSSPSGSARKLEDDQLVALQRRGRLPGRPAHAGPALQALAGLQGRALPVGAGAARPHRPRDRPGRRRRCRPAPSRRVYKPEFGNFADLRDVPRQRRPAGRAAPGAAPGHHGADPPGRLRRASPATATFGKMVSEVDRAPPISQVDPQRPARSCTSRRRATRDVVGVVTTLEGPPSGDIASRIGGFTDVDGDGGQPGGIAGPGHPGRAAARRTTCTTTTRTTRRSWPTAAASACSTTRCSTARTCSTRSSCSVELREMLVVRQGEVAVIKSYVGLPTEDTSGEEFKFGSIVKPGHQGIWSEPLRTGKYTLNPRIYEAEIVPTSILTLNWSHATSEAHSLDARLAPIDAKSKEALHLQHRPAGADPRARHPGAEGHLDGRHHAEPRQRGAAVGGRQLLPQQAADAGRHRVHREARRGAEPRPRATSSSTCRATRSRPAASTSRTSCSRPTWSRC